MMPRVIGNDSLIKRVNEVQGVMYRQSNELGRLNKAVKKYKDESAKLRELLRNALTYIECEGCGVECPETGHGATLTPCDICNRYETESCAYEIAQSARELGIEVK